jgi:leucyl-tRNA synthetase
MGPLTDSLPWSDSGLNGVHKWLDRVYRLFNENNVEWTDEKIDPQLDTAFHKFIKQVTQDINTYGFNTAISQMMIYINECYAHKVLSKQHMQDFLIVLSCFAPHLAEEIWHEVFKHNSSITKQAWPKYIESKTVASSITLPIQENGKLRATINIKKDASQTEAEKLAYAEPQVIKFMDGRKPKKVIYVKNRILNFIF